MHLFIPTIGIFAFQMSIDIIISKRRELTIGTIGTFECPLVAKWSPFILTHRLVASFPTCLAVPPTGKHVFTPFEKASNSLMRPSSRSRSIYHSWCCTDYIIAQYGYYALKACKIKLIYFFFCLYLFEKGYHVDGIVNNPPLYLNILLTEHISHWYSIFFILHHIGKCIMPFIVLTRLDLYRQHVTSILYHKVQLSLLLAVEIV